MKFFTLLLVAITTFGGIKAISCTCARPLSLLDAFKRYDAIFEGTVLDVSRATSSEYSEKMVRIKVTKNLKGLPDKSEVVVRTASMSAACGYHFDVGETYLVKANFDNDGNLHTGLCSGNQLISNNKNAGNE